MNKIVKINEDCSEDTSEEDQQELLESEDESESSECVESGETKGPLDSEEGKCFKVYQSKKRMRILSSCDSEDGRTSVSSTSQNVMGEIEIAVDGTRWIRLKAGRFVFKDIAGLNIWLRQDKYYIGSCN